ncbi:hypothetical protein F4782DRAFT_521156 [Xylaria castorea]|nr:hypothetical protein F4782DRAFT_521156 [Xylaria castorea]
MAVNHTMSSRSIGSLLSPYETDVSHSIFRLHKSKNHQAERIERECVIYNHNARGFERNELRPHMGTGVMVVLSEPRAPGSRNLVTTRTATAPRAHKPRMSTVRMRMKAIYQVHNYSSRCSPSRRQVESLARERKYKCQLNPARISSAFLHSPSPRALLSQFMSLYP